MKALCVVPYGMEEGTEAEIRQKEFGLVVGEPAVFHLLASTVRKKDQIGEIVEDWQGEIEEVTTMEAVLLVSEGEEKGRGRPDMAAKPDDRDRDPGTLVRIPG